MTTKWRVTATLRGRRIATSRHWETKEGAQKYADETNVFKGFNARVVKDSERVRRMIP